MTLQASGAISISQINSEFGRGNNLNAYRGTSHSGGTFPTGAISFSNFYGTSAQATGTFSPNGSTSSGSRTYLYGNASGGGTASYTISCTQSAVWTYSRIVGFRGSADIASGSTATSITFTLGAVPSADISGWNIDATSGANTRYWYLELENYGSCSRCCFTPDTLITMADGSAKPIAEIQAGDLILSRDSVTGLNVFATVTNVITRQDRPMYEFRFADGGVLNASEDHPLYTLGKGWASVGGIGNYKDLGTVKTIVVGDRVVGIDGTSTEVLSINPIEFSGTVYTLGNTRFYANGILVY